MVGYLSKQQNLLFRIKAGGACLTGGEQGCYHRLFMAFIIPSLGWYKLNLWWRLGLLLLGIHGLKHTMLEVVVVELIIIDVYGSTVFGVVKDYIYNNTGG